MIALVVAELGDHREEAQLVDRGPVDAAEERVRQAVHHRPAEPVAKKRPDRDVLAVEPARQHHVEPGPQLLRPREEPRGREGAIRVGRTRPIPSGIGIISPRARMWTRRGSVVPDDRLAEAELAAELRGRRPVGDERVRPGLHQEAVDPLGPDLAAEPLRRLDEQDGTPARVSCTRPRGR